MRLRWFMIFSLACLAIVSAGILLMGPRSTSSTGGDDFGQSQQLATTSPADRNWLDQIRDRLPSRFRANDGVIQDSFAGSLQKGSDRLNHGHDHGDGSNHDHDHTGSNKTDGNGDDHENHIDISALAAQNLGLEFTLVSFSDYARRLHIPASVIEKPGQSGLSVTSPVQGVISEIHRFPGQSLDEGDLLFTIQVADQALEAAQLTLLEILTRITVAQREIERLDPLTESGVVIGRRKLEIEYQLKQLESEQSAKLQELKLRGLSDSQIERIIQYRELIDRVEIRLQIRNPMASIPTARAIEAARSPAIEMLADDTIDGSKSADEADEGEAITVSLDSNLATTGPIYTVEALNVFPGMTVAKGEELCHIASHQELYIRGEAFDSDLAIVRQAMQQGTPITAETGEESSRERIPNLRIKYMDNHADPVSRTFPFYLALANQVVAEQQDDQGRLFRSWQFKPGQRAHLYLPVETLTGQIVLPRDAVIRSGPEAFVFRVEEDCLRESSITLTEKMADLERLKIWEFEPVSVRVLHQDQSIVVIRTGDELELDDMVVTNQAYQIYLAWKLQLSGGGGGHDHDH